MSLDMAPEARRAVRALKTAEVIALQLRGRIVRGELTPGDRLPSETELMERLGVSRPTLREAFRILEAESLLIVRRGSRGGAIVTAPDISVASRYVGLILQIEGATIGEVYEARLALEPACARLFARRRTEQDLTDLRERIDELAAEVDSEGGEPNPVRCSQLIDRIHEVVAQGSGNKALALQWNLLREIVGMHLAALVTRDIGEPRAIDLFRRSIRSYRKFVGLVEAQDADGAERHWHAHLEGAAQILTSGGHKSTMVVDLFD